METYLAVRRDAMLSMLAVAWCRGQAAVKGQIASPTSMHAYFMSEVPKGTSKTGRRSHQILLRCLRALPAKSMFWLWALRSAWEIGRGEDRKPH
eukprot:scaffold6733_cov16-Prasinocladus_malaysianus.AAC.2